MLRINNITKLSKKPDAFGFRQGFAKPTEGASIPCELSACALLDMHTFVDDNMSELLEEATAPTKSLSNED